ncbi:MAG: CDP-alcohol phosphatidyltransferase family protein [Trueperaceae bacterium]|nr:MAG: CDP-alcohol phosphatidyltransferase family protein [Trueperaceae bacterium]
MRLIHPLARVGVRLFSYLGVNPLHLVVTHGLLGLIAAWLIAKEPPGLLLAALLLQVKTLLDNIDGGLARATGQVTQMGRYLDTGIDLIVNFVLFLALSRYGPLGPAMVAFLILTVLLSFDFNLERLHKRAFSDRADQTSGRAQDPEPIGAPRSLFFLFRGIYLLLLAPQDRLIERLELWRFRRLSGQSYLDADPVQKRAWSDLFSTASVVNLGLSTQLFVLGVFLVVGRPYGYVYAIFFQGGYFLWVQLLRTDRFRRTLRGGDRP